MSLDKRPETDAQLRTREQLFAPFLAAMKPRAKHRIGLEHESIGFLGQGPIPYSGARGIEALLHRFSRWGFEPFLENGRPIATLKGMLTVSLEPGGQVELAGSPLASVRDIAREQSEHFARLRALAAELGLRFTSLGYRPFGTTQNGQWVPKERYGIMREHLGQSGAFGLDMMLMTGTAQANLDYSDEKDLASKVAASSAASPLVTALCANSSIVDGKPSGYLSYRMRVWEDVDNTRAGLLALGLRDFTLEKYVEWALDAPMIFIRRGGQYLSPRGLSFREFMKRGLDGESATPVDWADHLTTLFPDVRVKSVVELRSADAAGQDLANALIALWKGVLYDGVARDEAIALCELITDAERQQLRKDVARRALDAPFGRGRAREAAVDLVGIARRGLVRQGCQDETDFLDPLEEIAHTGVTRAEKLLRAYERGGPEAVIAASAV